MKDSKNFNFSVVIIEFIWRNHWRIVRATLSSESLFLDYQMFKDKTHREKTRAKKLVLTCKETKKEKRKGKEQ